MMRWWAAFFMCGMAFPTGVGGAAAALAAAAGAWIVRERAGGRRSGMGDGGGARSLSRFVVLVAGALVLWQTAAVESISIDGPDGAAARRRGPYGGRPGAAAGMERRGGIASLSMSGARSRLVSRLDDGRLSPRGRGFVGALVLGDRGGLAASVRERYSYLGIAHFLALSGLHLGVIAVPLAKLLSLLLPRRRLRDAALLSLLALYASIACFPPSLVRALALAGAFTIYRFAGVSGSLSGSLVAGSFTVAAIDGRAVFEPGFQLSFAAVLGIAAIGVPVTRALGRVVPRGIAGAGARIVAYPAVITCAVQFATLPLVLALFGRAPIVSPLVNVIVALPFTALIYAGAIYVFAPLAPVRLVLAPPIELACRFLDEIPAAFARGPQPAIVAGDVDPVVYVCGVAATAIALGRTRRRGALLAISAALVACSFCEPFAVARPDRPRRGAGGSAASAVLLSRDDGYAYLAAGGGLLFLGDRFGAAEARRLSRELWARGVRSVDRCVLVPAALRRDHGVFLIAARVRMREIVCSPYAASREGRRLEALASRGITVTAAPIGSRLSGPGVLVVITGPPFPPPAGRPVPGAEASLAFEIVEPRVGGRIETGAFLPRRPERPGNR
jgi:competence protein ComEC